MSGNVKDRVEQELRDTGVLSSSDLGAFTRDEEKKEDRPNPEALEQDDKIEVPEEASKDPAIGAGEEPDPSQLLSMSMAFGELDDNVVEVTSDEKAAFLESLVSGERYMFEYALFNNKISVTYRSRLAKETSAILAELRRQTMDGTLSNDVDYLTALRYSVMMFQVATINNIGYEIPKELHATSEMDDGKEVVTPPEWYTRAHELFGSKEEALTQALFNGLREFERKYWAMTHEAQNQDFWQTEDSTSA